MRLVSLLFYRISIKMEMDEISNSFIRGESVDWDDFILYFSDHLLSMWSGDCNWAFYKAWKPPNIIPGPAPTHAARGSGSGNRNHMNWDTRCDPEPEMRVAAVDNSCYCLVTAPNFSEALEWDGSLGGGSVHYRIFIHKSGSGEQNGYLCKNWVNDQLYKTNKVQTNKQLINNK